MSPIVYITRREIRSYFLSPVAYAFMVVFLAVTAAAFYLSLKSYMMQPAFELQNRGVRLQSFLVAGPLGLATWASIAMLLSLPGLSMRLFTEERKDGTAELLLTSPLTTVDLVLGKYCGTLFVFLALLVLTLPMIAFLGWKASPEWGAMGAAYLGMFLYGAFVLAVGLFASTVTEVQFVALVVTYAILLPFRSIHFAMGLGGQWLDDLVRNLSMRHAMHWAAQGVVDSHYVVLHGVLAFLFLFLAVRVLDSGRWR